MDTRDLYKLVRNLSEERSNEITIRDSVTLQISEHLAIHTGVIGFAKDGIILEADQATLEQLNMHGKLGEVRQPSLFTKAELPKTPIKKELDMGKWMDKYEELEDYNEHSECVVLLAKTFGTPEQLETAKDILRQQMKLGHMPYELGQKRLQLSSLLYPKAVASYKLWAAKNPNKHKSRGGIGIGNEYDSEDEPNEGMKLGGGGDAASSGSFLMGENGDELNETKVYVCDPNGNLLVLESTAPKKVATRLKESYVINHNCGKHWKSRYWVCLL